MRLAAEGPDMPPSAGSREPERTHRGPALSQCSRSAREANKKSRHLLIIEATESEVMRVLSGNLSRDACNLASSKSHLSTLANGEGEHRNRKPQHARRFTMPSASINYHGQPATAVGAPNSARSTHRLMPAGSTRNRRKYRRRPASPTRASWRRARCARRWACGLA